MSVYMIIETITKNKEVYSQYVDKVSDIVIKHGGRYLVRGGKITPFTNNWLPERIIIIEFENENQIQKCFQSPEYLEIASLRESSTITKAVILEGC